MHHAAFLFPGQGSQFVGMKSAMAEDYDIIEATFNTASGVLGYDLWEVAQVGPEERLNQTEVTQPAMLAAGIATWRVWRSLGGFDPDFLAGHSLGEYSALVASGALDFEEAVALVAERGRLMQSAVPAGVGAVAAVLGLDEEALSGICAEVAGDEVVSCANFNSPGQVAIAGHRAAVDRACEKALAAGAKRTIPLPVSVPVHCELMKPAADQLAVKLEEVRIRKGHIPVVHNYDVELHADPAEVKEALIQQIWQPVRWSETIQWMIAREVSHFGECGPGKVLTGLNRRISRDVISTPLISHADLVDTIANWI